ncbi:lysophospholipase, partial [Phenoliferia sp. Uapishka_3]
MLAALIPVLGLLAVVRSQESSYAPTLVTCPSTLISRTGSPLEGNQTLDASEATYLSSRRSNVVSSLWSSYISNTSYGDTGYNFSQLFPNSTSYPRVSTAISGGGYRASLYGAGTLSALDSRNATNAAPILQLSDYLSGLSGGSWAVSSLAMNDLPDLFSLVLGENGQTGWMLDLALLDPDGLTGLIKDQEYYSTILADVRAKADVGFPVSLVDVWGRALAFHFFNGTDRTNFYNETAPHDQGLLWSSIKYTQNFDNFAMPFPIVVSTSRVSEQMQNSSDTTVIPLSNTQFEFTPYTWGSFDPTLMARIPLELAGTYADNGVPTNSTSCVNGFENAGFVIGTSAALFNAVEGELSDSFTSAITTLGDDLAGIQNSNLSVPLVANYPNTFHNFVPSASATFESAGNTILQLTDGGENGENVPLSPLLVKARMQDILIAVDGSADTDFAWPNGTSLIATADRVASWGGNFSSFPPIPTSADDFVNEGLNVRPTFFGCNVTGNGVASVLGNYPIVVYLPNAPNPDATSSSYSTNVTTLTLDYSQEDQVSFLDAAHLNGLKGFQTESASSDPDWPLALKCALVDRARTRAGLARTAACATQVSIFTRSRP